MSIGALLSPWHRRLREMPKGGSQYSHYQACCKSYCRAETRRVSAHFLSPQGKGRLIAIPRGLHCILGRNRLRSWRGDGVFARKLFDNISDCAFNHLARPDVLRHAFANRHPLPVARPTVRIPSKDATATLYVHAESGNSFGAMIAREVTGTRFLIKCAKAARRLIEMDQHPFGQWYVAMPTASIGLPHEKRDTGVHKIFAGSLDRPLLRCASQRIDFLAFHNLLRPLNTHDTPRLRIDEPGEVRRPSF